MAATDGNRLLGAALVAMLAFGGFNLLNTVAGAFGGATAGPPQPPDSAAHALPVAPAYAPEQQRTAKGSTAVAPPSSSSATAAPYFAPAMPYAVPMRIAIPRVGIDAALIKVGLTRSGALGVPRLGDALKAAWYRRGPAPGQTGPAVIDAHVDSRAVPGNRAAFYSLGAVRPGDRVDVARKDGQVAEFTVDSVELVRKRDFPTEKVYGAVPYAALRLITCGGAFQQGIGYLDNVIVYAHLTGRHRA